MEERIETGFLFSFYGPLLTDRQRSLLSLWCEEDLTLSEIAAQEGISRQCVHDTVRSAQNRLKGLEGQLGLVQKYRRLTNGLQNCLKEIHMIHGEAARHVEEDLKRLLDWEEGEDGL